MNKFLFFIIQQFRIGLFVICLLGLTNNVSGNNPKLSTYLVNLSSAMNPGPIDDVKPEMVIVGNTIHVVWLEYKYGAESPLYYCRSVDLGKTWETPKQLLKMKEGGIAFYVNSRKLAVDGNNVHVAVIDVSSGIFRLYYIQSVNNGSTFSAARELASVTGGDSFKISNIKAASGKVAIAFLQTYTPSTVKILYSGNGGSSFTETPVVSNSATMADFWYDGNVMVVLHEGSGQVFVSVSNNNAVSFVTNKISPSYTDQYGQIKESCASYHDQHYSPKIAKSANFIHVVFNGYSDKGVWGILYARSTDNGVTFEKGKDINNGIENSIQSGQETVAAKNGHVYISYVNTGAILYFCQSSTDGASFTAVRKILPEGFTYVGLAWYPTLVIDPNDASGSTLYTTSKAMFSTKSVDGGKTFSESLFAAPLLMGDANDMWSDLAIDSKGAKHWISQAILRGGTDRDVFYRYIGPQPEPGTKNKALSLETVYVSKVETVTVPSSNSLDFDSAMTAEAWVKFDPSTVTGLNILGKVNGNDAWVHNPEGYQVGYSMVDGKYCIYSGIETDKGDFINWGDCGVGDTLWHHIAFTYDYKSGLNNFKTYLDGLLKVQQTVTGKIKKGNGLLMIGSRADTQGTTKYQIDNIRLWNRALSQDELLKNQVKTFTGKEAGLNLFLNFDDTFKDISGNGNDAVPNYLGELRNSNFNPPIPAFDVYQNMNQLSLTNKTQNGKNYKWNFGDGTVSDKGNPVYNYPKPGEYVITLEAMNANSKTALIKNTTVAGLDRIEPNNGGNSGMVTLQVYGGGITVDGTTVFLRKSGNSDIIGDGLYSPVKGVLSARFNLIGAVLGKWDVVVKKGSSEQILKEAFQVVIGIAADPWVSISGRGAIIFNSWQSYSINYGNNGNIDAYGVPVFFAITDDIQLGVEFIDFTLEPSALAVQKGIDTQLKNLGPYALVDKVMGENMSARIYSIMIPVIPAKSSSCFHLRIKTPKSVKIKIWNYPSWIESISATGEANLKSCNLTSTSMGPVSPLVAGCMAAAILEAGIDVALTVMTPDAVGCINSVSKTAFSLKTVPPRDKSFSGWNLFWNITSVAIDCVLPLTPIGPIYRGIASVLTNSVQAYSNLKSCWNVGYCDNLFNLLINAVGSFDPNEIIGPSGYGTNHWIKRNNSIPYTILFENKSSATAPAHVVTIKDTLDISKFNISDFGFGSFGFGDTTLLPPGNNLKSFSVDVDLRPNKNLIARVSGKLDTVKAIVTWEFLSLNPTTMMLEEDPLVGFLPPNNSTRQGEGFVSYSVGLKPELKTNTVIKNKASIVFDANKPIMTNEYVNTLDLDKPQSSVLALPAQKGEAPLTVSWSGSDQGSGIRDYTIMVLDNDTLKPWLVNTTQTTGQFPVKLNHTYKFYSVVTDNVSLLENAPNGYDAQTTIVVGVQDLKWIEEKLAVYPNPASGELKVSISHPPCGMYVVELVGMTGAKYHSQIYDDLSINQGVQIDLKNCTSGQYIVRIIYGNKFVTRKIFIK